MKKLIYLIVLALILGLVLAGCSSLSNVGQVPATEQMKAKPAGNPGAQTYAWHLSADVMPVPPYGSMDIPGSDIASKLIVNQPNGNTEVTITGVMKGLDPNTVYTVYPSNDWSKSLKWNIVGDWNLTFMLGGAYNHDMTVTFQNMYTGAFSGYGHSNTDSSIWDIQATSKVSGNTIHLDLIYTGANAGYTVEAIGEIDTNGYIVNGNWSSSASQSGSWSSTSGYAIGEMVGNGHPGLFPGQDTFTFLTDEYGAGSWHFNLKNDDFPGSGSYDLSVWINKASATILISDNFTVVVE